MNTIKRVLGFFWILLGFVAGYYLLIFQAIPKFVSPQPEDRIPAIIYAFILTPLVVGSFLIFGYYAWIGEYDQSE